MIIGQNISVTKINHHLHPWFIALSKNPFSRREIEMIQFMVHVPPNKPNVTFGGSYMHMLPNKVRFESLTMKILNIRATIIQSIF